MEDERSGGDFPAASQCSQVDASQAESYEDFKCSICMSLLHEPITHAACHNSFCRKCYFPAITAAGGGRAAAADGRSSAVGTCAALKACPLCRGAISLEEASAARVDEVLWVAIRSAFPAQVAARYASEREAAKKAANEAAAAAAAGGGDAATAAATAAVAAAAASSSSALPLSLRRDLARDEMRRHQATLEGANPAYFRLLEAELRRPGGELVRCRCPARFVALRGRIAHGPSAGREYYGCPLYRREGRRGSDYCGLWMWDP